jgi:5'-3' exonuclease/transcription antitermination factor NusG
VLVTTEWVVLELSPQGEDEDPEVLHKALHRMMKGKEFFIPASVIKVPGGSRVVHKLIDNYVFVKRLMSDSEFIKFENTKYISSVLTIAGGGSRRIACVSDPDIERMRRQIRVETEQGIQVGDEVMVMSGPYKNLKGKVIEEIPETDSVQIYISLRSKQALVTLPRTFLRFVTNNNDEQHFHSPFFTKVTRIRDWVRKSTPLVTSRPPSIKPLEVGYKSILQLNRWCVTARHHLRLIGDAASPSEVIRGKDGVPLTIKYRRFQEMDTFVKRTGFLFFKPKLDSLIQGDSLLPLERRLSDIVWLQDVIQRVVTIRESVEVIERSIPDWDQSMVQNLIFDGHNLAYRSEKALRFVPGGTLTDLEGKPTSIIFGFLRSVAVLRKRFDQANIYVVWDGSRQRRVKDYPEYKATREPHGDEVHEEMQRLREILPLFGINQAYNPDEETDDLIAHLVKVKHKGKHNLIVSTDRDFLQLVTYTDLVLVPKVGSRPETLYDPDKVVLEYGVAPSRMTHLRSLIGDDSDNLPGVARIPRKVIASLLTTHGSLEGLLNSSLAGVTPAQYAKIRAFEAQARLNLKLMTLCEDVECPITEAALDRDAALSALKGCAIQPESIMGSFFGSQPGTGFSKTA